MLREDPLYAVAWMGQSIDHRSILAAYRVAPVLTLQYLWQDTYILLPQVAVFPPSIPFPSSCKRGPAHFSNNIFLAFFDTVNTLTARATCLSP